MLLVVAPPTPEEEEEGFLVVEDGLVYAEPKAVEFEEPKAGEGEDLRAGDARAEAEVGCEELLWRLEGIVSVR